MAHDHGQLIPLSDKSLNRAFLLGIGLNAAFTLAEFIAGFMYDSLALLSDAGHNLSDWERIKEKQKQYLNHKGIQHVTIELEVGEQCSDADC